MIALGLGFGDEGKGLTTSYLCSTAKNPLVVRFNGGHQAGHTVVYNGKRHIFSSFGSGTLQGFPTYWSKQCTFYPNAFVKEHEELAKIGVDPKIYVNSLSPVTTPYDVLFNKISEKVNGHGSVGVGFGATIERQENNVKLFVQDLFHKEILEHKLVAIDQYYAWKRKEYNVAKMPYQQQLPELSIDIFLDNIEKAKKLIKLDNGDLIRENIYSKTAYTLIYEGAQGIMLDKDFGFFPNVTRSNTTSKGVTQSNEVFYITRSYQTRHGNGPMVGNRPVTLKNNENESNVFNESQGQFRTCHLEPSLINYALECDNHFSEGGIKNLVVTCMDQYEIDMPELLSKIHTKFDKVFVSYGPSLENLKQYI